MFARASALVLLVVCATPALAYCPSLPDDGTTGYVANSTGTAVCLQRELAVDTYRAAEQARIEAQLNQLQQDLLRRQLQPPLTLPTWPQPQ
jgi:hypothetical protein